MNSFFKAHACALIFCSLTLNAFAQTTPVKNPGSLMNPDLAVDGLFSLSQFSQSDPLVFDNGHDPRQSGFNIQQVELTFGANVDPTFRADASIVLTPAGVEIEEAYATTTALPAGFQVKAGQFFTAFGRHNPQHPHAWDFANKPLVLGRFFGGDGLRNPGAQVSWLSPLPWYSEVIASAQNSNGETAASFNSAGTMRSAKDSLFLGRWNNFFSLSDELALNLGASFLTGRNATVDKWKATRIFGADFYLKFREQSSLSFVSLQGEVLKRLYNTTAVDDTGNIFDDGRKDWGGYTQVNMRLPESWNRWHVGLRYDWVSAKGGVPVTTVTGTDATGTAFDRDTAQRWRVSPVITFYPSEFSKIRAQYEYDKPSDTSRAQQVVTLQLEFLMGAHGAHKF